MGQIIHGDALVELRKLSSNSIDALCVDPPASISFMGKSWDGDKGGRSQWVAWLAEIMQETLRVMKPGAHGLVWALPRTSHWTALALEDAGFEIRDCVYHIQGAGFPKSHNISAAIDRHFKVERKIIGISPAKNSMGRLQEAYKEHGARKYTKGLSEAINVEKYGGIPITEPATEEAQVWSGWGTALKPACEVWWLIRKPLTEKSVAENVLKWGVGGINIDACRVGSDLMTEGRMTQNSGGVLNCNGRDIVNGNWKQKPNDNPTTHIGRWPAHLLLSHSIFCVPNGTKHVRGHTPGNIPGSAKSSHPVYGDYANHGNNVHYTDADGMEEVEDWICDESCPVKLLDEQSGVRKSGGMAYGPSFTTSNSYGDYSHRSTVYHDDQGGASRYFQQFYYCSKASRKDRTANGTVENNHPTVKPLELIKYLTRLICPPGGIVLDCFAGSGTTALACIAEGFDYILVEQDKDYCDIAHARVSHVMNEER